MTLDERIAEAENQYHLLVTGQLARVVVNQNGERVEYALSKSASLKSYIDELKSEKAGHKRIQPPVGMIF